MRTNRVIIKRPASEVREPPVRAVVFTSPSEPVMVREVELDPPGPGEVSVAIAAAGVCHSDLHVRRGDWRPPAPPGTGPAGPPPAKKARPRPHAPPTAPTPEARPVAP